MASISGAGELVGKGVYQGMPHTVPPPTRTRHAVIVGEREACISAARQLDEVGWKVTVVTRDRYRRCDRSHKCRHRCDTEVVCATGIQYLEALVLRRVSTGRIGALNASVLVVT